MKKIAILGSTGSIGTQSLDVIRRFPDKFKVVSMTCGKNTELFRKQLKEFRPLFALLEATRAPSMKPVTEYIAPARANTHAVSLFMFIRSRPLSSRYFY